MSAKKTVVSGHIPRDEKGRLLPEPSLNTAGRPKGSKNKFTQLKNVFLEALEEVGGKEYVKVVARSDP